METRMTSTGANTQLTPKQQLANMLTAPSVQEMFKNACGRHADSFIASITDLYAGDSALQTCKPADVIMQCAKAATLRLPINKALGFAYVVVYKNNVKRPDGTWEKVPTPTFIPGYKGYIQLALRSGHYKTINADVVYEGELRRVSKLTGEINLEGERKSDKVVGYFAYIELVNGFTKTLYMSVEDMAAYAKRYSPSVGRDTTKEQLAALANAPLSSSKKVGWEGDFNAMAQKTCLRRLLSKYGELSVEMETALAADMAVEEQHTTDMQNGPQTEEIVVDADGVVYEEEGQQPSEPAPTTTPTPSAAQTANAATHTSNAVKASGKASQEAWKAKKAAEQSELPY